MNAFSFNRRLVRFPLIIKQANMISAPCRPLYSRLCHTNGWKVLHKAFAMWHRHILQNYSLRPALQDHLPSVSDRLSSYFHAAGKIDISTWLFFSSSAFSESSWPASIFLYKSTICPGAPSGHEFALIKVRRTTCHSNF